MTPRRLGMGSMYCFASATGAQPNGDAAAQSTTATHRQSLSCSVCLRGSTNASTKPDRPSDAEKSDRTARTNAVSGPGAGPSRVCRRCPVSAIPGVRPHRATKIQDQASARTAAAPSHGPGVTSTVSDSDRRTANRAATTSWSTSHAAMPARSIAQPASRLVVDAHPVRRAGAARQGGGSEGKDTATGATGASEMATLTGDAGPESSGLRCMRRDATSVAGAVN